MITISPVEPSVGVIESVEDLEGFAGEIASCARVAVDVEADSFYSYHPKVCLVQISTDTQDVVIDPLAVKDMSPLSHIFREPRVEKVLHAAEYDIQCLKRDYGFRLRGLFDTMAAARILGYPQLGLAPVILKHFGVGLSKKLQRADWGKRPLSEEQIEYARLDTHYLLRLRDKLGAELEAKGFLRDAEEAFAKLEEIEPVERAFDPDSFWRLPGAKSMSPQARAVLKELYFFREKTAAAMDRAPFRVLPEKLLIQAAEAAPGDLSALAAVPGMTPYLLRNYGPALLGAIEAGLKAPPIESPPRRERGEPWSGAALQRYQRLKEWRKARAHERGVDTVVILRTDELRALAGSPDGAESESDWLACLSDRKRELYGEELIRLLTVPVAAAAGRRRRGRR